MEYEAAATMEAMPRELHTAVGNFIKALALEAGAAIDAGKEPPGGRVGENGRRYLVQIPGEPVIIEYVVDHKIRELRIPVLLWIG
ncbi:hypothetical protein ITX44_36400 [Streptomyces sp. KK5PA1]|uniref:Uncharacterized protein n=2 Tax=Actinacidiphila acididurans TaxID=2784346 RepID=A0ABS2U2W6_9ACTN|nr:hypothetical protein [Actinacidiphila acididurans]